jgi:hypothetical protein
MTKHFLIAAAILGLTSLPAFASFAPIKYDADRDAIAASCSKLGSNGQGYGLTGDFGAYGCRNLDNGNAVQCTADGQCTDYSGDFRWKTMRKYFKGVTTDSLRPRSA